MDSKKISKVVEKDDDIEVLEKDVQKEQVKTFFKVIPILMTQALINTLLNIETKEKEKRLYLPTSSSEDIKKTSFLTTNQENEIVEIEITTDKYKNGIVRVQSEEEKEANKEARTVIIPSLKPERVSLDNNIEDLSNDKKEESKKAEEAIDILFDDKQWQNVRAKKIIETYEEDLKRVRRELRSEIFNYNMINIDKDIDENEINELLAKINLIIKKLEKLKDGISIENVSLYNDNYIIDIVNSYIKDFKSEKVVEGLKDSSLYILISKKLEELSNKKDRINAENEKEKEKKQLDDESLSRIKDKYSDFNNLNDKLRAFQEGQEALLMEIDTKLANQVTVEQMQRTTILGISNQTQNLLNFTASQMILPGARSAKAMMTATAISTYYMRRLMNPTRRQQRVRRIRVTDYSKEIESSISDLDNILSQITKTEGQITSVIKEFKKKFKEYIGVSKEVDDILKNLERVSDELKEKEYEIERIREEQKLNLEKNDAKVKEYS